MGLLTVSSNTMKQSDNVIVLGAGPSLDAVCGRVQEWYNTMDPIVIGTHHKYFIPSNYTVFDTPDRFLNMQSKLRGYYLVSDRIKDEHIKKKNKTKTMRIRYGTVSLLQWEADKFFIESNKIPYGAPGWDAVCIATFCHPKNLLIAGIDGYSISEGSVAIEHAKKSSVQYASNTRPIRVFKNAKQKATYTLHEKLRRKMVPKIFHYMIHELGINVHIYEESRFHGANKDDLEKIGVSIIRKGSK